MKAAPILAFLAFLALRGVALSDYPAIHPDEGFWAVGPRNLIRFGDAFMDDRLHPYLSPAHFTLLVGWFSLAPPGLIAARLFSVLAGFLTGLLVWRLARGLQPRQRWLFFGLFAVSSLSVLIHRSALLEAHQLLWLVLAAALWLEARPWSAPAAGAAFGLALLVKANSIYLLPAFLLTANRIESTPSAVPTPAPRPVLSAALFFLVCALIAGSGYLLAWSHGPQGFVDAFRYEIDGMHFRNGGEWFHLGRFGLHPARTAANLRKLLITEPFLVVLAAAAIVLLWRGRRQATTCDRFFAAWAVFGLLFHFGQIYIAPRYFATLSPAFAYLAARVLAILMTPAGATGSLSYWRPLSRSLGIGIVLAFIAYHGVRFSLGIARPKNNAYWQTVVWMREHVPEESNVLAAPVVGLSLPQRSYDFYRVAHGYDGAVRPLRSVVERYDIRFIIVEPEWRLYQTAEMAEFLAGHGKQETSIAETIIYSVPKAF